MIDIDVEEAKIRRQLIQLSQAREKAEELRERLKKARRYEEDCRQAQKILQTLAQSVQEQIHSRLASVVSTCLSAVFDDPYEFKLLFVQKRGRTEAVLEFDRRGLALDPMTSSGGGMVDVAAFALRVACLMLANPEVRIVVLDEPFKFVSSQYRENVRTMLEELSKELGLQVIMVTHIDELETGEVIRLR